VILFLMSMLVCMKHAYFSYRILSLLSYSCTYVLLNLFLWPCFLNGAYLVVILKLNLIMQVAFKILFHEVIFQFVRFTIVTFAYYYL
jgi:hypothetical protein